MVLPNVCGVVEYLGSFLSNCAITSTTPGRPKQFHAKLICWINDRLRLCPSKHETSALSVE